VAFIDGNILHEHDPGCPEMTPESHNGRPLLSNDNAGNTQVVILDNREDGPYFDLWRLFARKPTIRRNVTPKDIPAVSGNIIIPL
jgi:protein O-GlcNAc transferase